MKKRIQLDNHILPAGFVLLFSDAGSLFLKGRIGHLLLFVHLDVMDAECLHRRLILATNRRDKF